MADVGVIGLVRVVVDAPLNVVQDIRVVRRREHVSLCPDLELVENCLAKIRLEGSHVGASTFRGARRDLGHYAYEDQVDDRKAAVRDVAHIGRALSSFIRTPDYDCYGELGERSPE